MGAKKKIQFSYGQTIFLVLFAVLLTFGVVRFFQSGKTFFVKSLPITSSANQVDPSSLSKQLEQKDFTFINVHTPYDGEIAKTDLFIDYDKIGENQEKLPKDRSAKIILYCKTGKMSGEAVKKLEALNYTNVSHLQGGMEAWKKAGLKTFNIEELKKQVLPDGGYSAPVKWGNIGPRLVLLGVIDLQKFKETIQPTDEQVEILTQDTDKPISINNENSQFIVDVLWALGLAQKSKVYTDGPMGQEYKSKVGNLASTGGWTLGKRQAVDYLGKYDLVALDLRQQDRVYQIAQNVYRPCCGNPTSFPDCNHGMAALGLIELMVSEGLSDDEIYRAVLAFNSFWFPQSYLTLAASFSIDGISWESEAKKALGQEFSSGQGAAKISQKIGRLPYLYSSGGGGCGV